MGKSLKHFSTVSPSFLAHGLNDCRLVLDLRASLKEIEVRSLRKINISCLTQVISDFFLDGSVTLKINEARLPTLLEVYTSIGAHRRGPLFLDSSYSCVCCCDAFNINLLMEVSADDILKIEVFIFDVPFSI